METKANLAPEQLAAYIDHTILKAEATSAEVEQLCAEASEHGFASVCVNSCFSQLVSSKLQGTPVKTCVVVGFPLGAASTAAKVAEAKQALADGASEFDMVLAIGALKAGDYAYVEQDIRAVVEAVRPFGVKLIIECCLLSKAEIVKACQLGEQAGVAFVKTSTGFSTGGATVEDVKLMRATVGPACKVKASGGIRDYATAKAMLEAGAERIGASAGIKIIRGE